MTGITGSRTDAKIGGVRRARCGLTRSFEAREVVRRTTRARRRASIGWPGFMTGAKASKMILQLSKDLLLLDVRRYFPAAKMAFSETIVC